MISSRVYRLKQPKTGPWRLEFFERRINYMTYFDGFVVRVTATGLYCLSFCNGNPRLPASPVRPTERNVKTNGPDWQNFRVNYLYNDRDKSSPTIPKVHRRSSPPAPRQHNPKCFQ